MSNRLGSLVHPVVWTSPVQDPHLEQVKEDQIIDSCLVHLLKPFYSPDHIGPELIVGEEVWVYVPPPLIVDNSLIIRFSGFPNPMEGVLGDLQFSVSVSISRNKEGNYLKHQRVMTKT